MTFKPWEIPTGGRAPGYEVSYEADVDGRRFVTVRSPWMLAVRKPSGELVPVDRLGGCWLDTGDELISPPSETEQIDAELVYQAKVRGYREYQQAHLERAPAFDEDERSQESFAYTPPERWWWHRRELPHGRVLHLQQASANARLTVSISARPFFIGTWCYPDHDDGWRAVLGWNGWGDPPDGWIRHLETARRRHDGTAATEYINAADMR